MKQIFFFIIALFFISCEQTEQDANENFKKATEFYKQKEYEIAEYYFDKIPEDNPLYSESQRILQEIDNIKLFSSEKLAKPEELRQVKVLNHTFTFNAETMEPKHNIKISSENTRTIRFMVLKFTYYNEVNQPVDQIVVRENLVMYGRVTDTFKDVIPGKVKSKFYSSRVEILSAEFDD